MQLVGKKKTPIKLRSLPSSNRNNRQGKLGIAIADFVEQFYLVPLRRHLCHVRGETRIDPNVYA